MIYFIEADGTDLVKIGFTDSDAERRLAELQTGSAHELKLLAVLRGDRTDEAYIHRALAQYRVRGEWFRLAGHFEGIFDAAWVVGKIGDLLRWGSSPQRTPQEVGA